MKVSAIVVTFNRLHLLKKCLKHLLKQTYKLNDIIVINNNSNDGTKDYLNSLKNPLIKYKNLNKNVGGSGGFSLGTKLSFEDTDSNYFWLMDDDSMPSSNALKKLVESSMKLNNHFGFLCSNVRSYEDNSPMNIPATATTWTELLPSNLIRVRMASFVSLFVPRYVVRDLGLPIRQMFIWGDDFEYTTRISNKYKAYFVMNSIIIHNSSANTLKNPESIFNSNRYNFYKYAYRNYLYTARKRFNYKKVIKTLANDIIDLLKVPFCSKNKRFQRFCCVLIGIIKGIYFNPKIEFPRTKTDDRGLHK